MRQRLSEAAKVGFKAAIIPAMNSRDVQSGDIEVRPIARIDQALAML